ncbi:MAG: phosphatase PAP2 family protein [Elusimicrobia bacterium]|nr:phosphatase PAP2 family protein [Elusimicrobiota bacterium]
MNIFKEKGAPENGGANGQREDYRRMTDFVQLDALMIAYLALTSLIYLKGGFFYPLYRLLFGLHWAVIAWVLWVRKFLQNRPSDGWSWLRWLHGWYPAILLGALYREVGVLNHIIGSRFYDDVIMAWEEWLLGETPAIWLSDWANSPLASNFFHLCYVSYYLMIPSLGFLFYFTRRFRLFQEYNFGLMASFFFCHAWFLLFPVDGPIYYMSSYVSPELRGIFFQVAHWFASWGDIHGGAFPSSHVAGCVFILIYAWKKSRSWFWALLPFGLGLAVSTVYGRFHYGVDVLAGAAVGLLISWAGPLLFGYLETLQVTQGLVPQPVFNTDRS